MCSSHQLKCIIDPVHVLVQLVELLQIELEVQGLPLVLLVHRGDQHLDEALRVLCVGAVGYRD